MNRPKKERLRDWETERLGQNSLSVSQSLNNRLVSLSQSCPGMSAAAFLHHGLGQARFYWADGTLTLAGFGTAAELFAWGELRFQQIEAQARELFAGAVIEGDVAAAPRLFGGFAFRDDFTPDNTWSVFHPAHFILPHFQFTQQGDQSWLTLNALLPPDEDPAQVLPDLREALVIRAAALGAKNWCDFGRKKPGALFMLFDSTGLRYKTLCQKF